jgi:hypothetical protein
MALPNTWYYSEQGTSVGPLSWEQMQALVHRGAISRDTLVWPGSGGWITAETSTLAAILPATPLPAVPPMPPNAASPKAGILKDKRVRRVIQILVAAIGLYAIYDGLGDVRSGISEFSSASNTQVALQGCVGVSANAIQCGYQNTGSVAAKLCMDVVVTCDDGRHVASSCSDKIPPGEVSTKLVDNFSPGIQPTTSCNDVKYENVKAQQ